MANRNPSLFRRIFGHTLFLVNLGVALWLGLCFLAAIVPPYTVTWLALFPLSLPFALLANIFFLFLWLFLARGKWRVVLPIFILALCYKLLLISFGWNFFGKNDMAPGPQRIKIMSWNVHGLGIFDNKGNNDKDERILDFIRNEQPDILCLPELYTQRRNTLQPYSARILEENEFQDFRFQYDNTLGTKIYLGIGVFSKYPIRDYQKISLAKGVNVLICDFELPDKKMLRGYFVHLQSFLLPDKDKAAIEDIKNRTAPLQAARGMGIPRRLLTAFYRRSLQTDKLAGELAKSPYPFFIAGDFNDVPGSYTYVRLKTGLYDAFEEKGRGLGRTYNLFSPTLRIDYLLYNPQALKILGYRSPRMNLSDHNPVIANFEIMDRESSMVNSQ